MCIRLIFIEGRECDSNKDSTLSEADMVTTDSVAMEQSSHLKFKGVPIDGELDWFVERIKRKGFELVSPRNEDMLRLRGDFAGFKQCMIYVTTFDNKDLVSQITVHFPVRDRWKNVYDDYKRLKEMLIEKYGRPVFYVERFVDSLGGSDEIYNMVAVRNGDCKYNTQFSKDEGDIILSIEPWTYTECFVQLVYKDKENDQTVRDAAIDDL